MMLGRLNALFGRGRYVALSLVPTLILSSAASAADGTYATEQRRHAAEGHYARARAMLVEALAEFEQGRKYARPDLLLDPEEWRLSVISRTEELNRVLDPKPKVTRDGVQFQASPLRIQRQKDRTPQPIEGAKDTNVYGEKMRQHDRREARARMEIPENEDTAEDQVQVVPKSETKKSAAVDNTATAKKAAESLSFDKPKEEAAVDSGNVVAGSETVDVAPPAPAEQAPVEEAATTAPVEAKPLKLIPAEEEVVTTKKVETTTTKKDLFNSGDEEEDEGASAKPQTVESKEDEVTKEIERAIQERIQQEKSGQADSAKADETSGE